MQAQTLTYTPVHTCVRTCTHTGTCIWGRGKWDSPRRDLSLIHTNVDFSCSAFSSCSETLSIPSRMWKLLRLGSTSLKQEQELLPPHPQCHGHRTWNSAGPNKHGLEGEWSESGAKGKVQREQAESKRSYSGSFLNYLPQTQEPPVFTFIHSFCIWTSLKLPCL